MTSLQQYSRKVSAAGAGALLLDAAKGPFDIDVQRRVWWVANAITHVDGVQEAVPGMNNLMVVFDPLTAAPEDVEATLLEIWDTARADAVTGREIDVPVFYGGPDGEDLAALAARAGLAVDEVIRRHSGATYTVAAIGAMPGFPYLAGLDPSLAWGRRPNPRMKVAEGSVIIGGAQAGIMPCTAPSGWHILGRTELKLFDVEKPQPAALRPGDTVRFTIAGIAQ
jgi:KipI family sensor histidine kinase inhibitor